MSAKRVFLLANARQVVDMVDLRGRYDDIAQLNVNYVDGRPRPLVLDAGVASTNSKTFAAPGDDDPDLEAEGCY